MATLDDVARLAGVSKSAVSRTFTSGASVSDKMRRKVKEAANELGYRPNALASSLTTGRTKMIGLISNNFHNPIFLEVFDQFTRGLQQRGLRPLIVNLTDETDPQNSIDMMQQYSVDGVIVASSTLSPHFAVAFRKANVPVVHCFGRNTPNPEVNVVGIDNVEAGRIAARELIKRGYERVGFLGGPEDATSTQDRCKGFREVVNETPHTSLSVSYANAYSFLAGREEMLRLIEGEYCQAYFCGDDILSLGALSAIREKGIKVPAEIGILGLNDMDMASWQGIDLTTIHQPIKQIINSSIEMIVSLLEEPAKYPEALLFPCKISERKTLRQVKDPSQL